MTLVDFAHTAFGAPTPLPVYLDDEGTPAQDAVLIREGILQGYMHSRESAQHFGMKPQGNAVSDTMSTVLSMSKATPEMVVSRRARPSFPFLIS